MNKFPGLPVWAAPVAVVGLATLGLTGASANYGKYTTRVPESRLFINGGRILRCDLFFSAANGGVQQIAPKGSRLNQSVPPVVWQYSGLLPVSDYLKSVAIHSVATDNKVRPWQDVQATFYDGLRTEGADMADAKIAFAGAYAFAPRWPLVQFVEVEEQEIVYPNTVLYEVEYVQPQMKGLSLEEYRKLALKILNQPQSVSIHDIRDAIDTADITRNKSRERASLGGIGDPMAGDMAGINATTETSEGIFSGIKAMLGSLKSGDEGVVSSIHKNSKGEKVAESLQNAGSVVVEIPELVVAQDLLSEDATLSAAESDVEKATVESIVLDNVTLTSKKVDALLLDEKDMILASGPELMALDGPQDDWITLPDGSMVLRSIQKLVSEK